MAAVISQATAIGAQPAISCIQVIIRAPVRTAGLDQASGAFHALRMATKKRH